MRRSRLLQVLVFLAFRAGDAQQQTQPGQPPIPSNAPLRMPPSGGNAGSASSGNGSLGGGESSGQIMLSGRVATADGSPLPDTVTIERICGSTVRAAAYTDGKGRFSFQWGQTAGMTPDASEPSPEGPRAGIAPNQTGSMRGFGGGSTLTGCALRADAAGYSSDSIFLDGHRPFDSADVGTIVLHRMANVEGISVSVTSLKAPPEAKKAYNKGLDSLRKRKPSDAQKDFEKAVAIYPLYANAWLNLGKLRMRFKETEPAREAFQKALDADDKLVEAHVELGMLAAGRSQWPEAAKQLDIALRLDPVDFPRVWFMDAVADFNLKNFDGAEKSAREALKLDPKHSNPEADRLLGLIAQVKAQLEEIQKMAGAAKP